MVSFSSKVIVLAYCMSIQVEGFNRQIQSAEKSVLRYERLLDLLKGSLTTPNSFGGISPSKLSALGINCEEEVKQLERRGNGIHIADSNIDGETEASTSRSPLANNATLSTRSNGSANSFREAEQLSPHRAGHSSPHTFFLHESLISTGGEFVPKGISNLNFTGESQSDHSMTFLIDSNGVGVRIDDARDDHDDEFHRKRAPVTSRVQTSRDDEWEESSNGNQAPSAIDIASVKGGTEVRTIWPNISVLSNELKANGTDSTKHISTHEDISENHLESPMLSKAVSEESLPGRWKSLLPSLKNLATSKVSLLFPADESRKLWRRRHARSLEEGIRRETGSGRDMAELSELSSLLDRTQFDTGSHEDVGRRFLERTIMGLINALVEEVEDLDVKIDERSETPPWRKELKEVRIEFSRLGLKPLRMGGFYVAETEPNSSEQAQKSAEGLELSRIRCADEAFQLIDVDNSGALDSSEIASALAMVSATDSDDETMEEFANELVEIYDSNGDGVVDREEYQRMVEDMAALQTARLEAKQGEGPLAGLKKSVQTFSQGIKNKAVEVADGSWASMASIGGNEEPESTPVKRFGSIVLSDLKLDLRRVLFGGIPVVKSVTPGDPLVLEPFTMTVKGSFSREDVMGSFLLDAGLRLLVARALRVRLRSFRDIVDGAYFFGRRWKMSSKSAPVVEVLGLSNVEFDKKDRMIVTGRARVRTSPEAPVVTNTFKVRTKIGTRKGGQAIRLVEPELAFVFECPQSFEKGAKILFEKLRLPVPKRPAPVYSFFPIYSPFKVNDNAGFDMGEDNRLRSICIKDGALQFEMRAVLRPGRFLGNHYLAFTLPMRTFIITTDRVREGIRTARRNKKIASRQKKLEAENQAQDSGNAADSGQADCSRVSNFVALNELRRRLFSRGRTRKNRAQLKSFFSRFVEGYTLTERDGEMKNARLTTAISDWFGRQGSGSSTGTSLERTITNETIF